MERKFDWNHIKDLQVLDWIPDHYDFEEKYLFRSPLLLINHLFWNQLLDYKFYNQINSTGDPIITVHGYYTSAIHCIRRLKVVEIPANEPFKQTIQIKNESPLRQNSIKQARLENCLDIKHSAELRAYLEYNFGIINLEEYCPPEMESLEIKGDMSVAPYDRVWVAWVIEVTVGIYREDTEGNVSLVGCSDYLFDFIPMIYPKSNNYWKLRFKDESLMKSPYFQTRNENFLFPKDINPDSLAHKELEKKQFKAYRDLAKKSNE